MSHILSTFFKPSGVALIGASSNPLKLSHGILTNMMQYGFQGKVYPVNPSSEEILGLRCYPDIYSVPNPIELAVIILPALQIPQILNGCGERGIKSVIIISGGFKEVNREGAELEEKIIGIAKHYDMRLIGPNCVGTVDLYSGLNTTFIKGLPDRGSIGFISQSGAICGGVVDLIQDMGVGFSHLISLGNEADVSEADMIDYLVEEPNTEVIAVYLESIKDGRRFIQISEIASWKKPIIVLKAGRSAAGARAVSSHTGSLAGSQSAYHAAFSQAGVLEADTIMEVIDIAQAFSCQPLPKGDRVAIITNAGGPAALTSDGISSNDLRLADLSPTTQKILRENLLPAAQVSNPVDMLGGAEAKDYGMALKTVLKDENVDSVIMILVPQSIVDPVKIAESIIEASKSCEKTVLTVMMGEKSIKDARTILAKNKMPLYVFPESPPRVLRMMYQYRKFRNMPIERDRGIKIFDKDHAHTLLSLFPSRQHFGEYETRPILEAYGIPIIQGSFAATSVESGVIADSIGYPVVLKIVSPDIVHKTEVGGIRLGLYDRKSVVEALNNITKDINKKIPDAIIEGFLVEATSPEGIEVIVGMKRDPNFGPMIMFGMGGIYVELITDIAFRIAPVNSKQAMAMITQTKAGKLLSGLRGQKTKDIIAIADIIMRISQLSMDFPQIEEVEINPLVVLDKGDGAIALDARMILSKIN